MGPGRRRVVWTHGALRDLEAGLSYIAEDSPENAAGVLERILDAADSLAELSERGRPVPEYAGSETRELLPHPFRLLYQVAKSQVFVLALLHQRRDFERWRATRGTGGEP
ncbi:MAG: type II toxin-antitoxin system RelE/ParE family toxin [Gemmatimonadota bacterium]